jgi:hypothetical protein
MIGIVTKVVVGLLATTKSSIFGHSFHMSISSASSTNDTSIWTSLKQAISASSGFQHWASQLPSIEHTNRTSEELIQLYLRETLETLAY